MSLKLSAHAYLYSFLLQQIANQPTAQALLLYRALAVETDDKLLSEACHKRADELESLIHNHRQMSLAFRRRNERNAT